MLIDLHEHTSGISHCCRLNAPEILKRTKEVGLDGIVLTNHYTKMYVDEENKTFSEWIEEYIYEYEYTKKCGLEIGCKVFFGVEVTAEWDRRVHLLIYGADDKFLREYPCLYDYSQKDLFELCQKKGYALIQAHPYRNDAPLLDTKYLHGVEINCHPIYQSTYSNVLPQIALQNGLTLTCGCDYHGDTPYRASGGTYLPDDTNNAMDIAKYILNTKKIKLRIQELHCPTFYEKEFEVNKWK